MYRIYVLGGFFFAGCSEYALEKNSNKNMGGEESFGILDENIVSCEEIDFSTVWYNTDDIYVEHPVLEDGKEWFALDINIDGWHVTALPDRSISPGADKIYATDVSLEHVPTHLYIELQSDDGIWLYINEHFIGHWGGDWQEEGCVNDEAQCSESENVAWVNVQDVLQKGNNRISVRVSNPVLGSYFQLIPHCSEN